MKIQKGTCFLIKNDFISDGEINQALELVRETLLDSGLNQTRQPDFTIFLRERAEMKDGFRLEVIGDRVNIHAGSSESARCGLISFLEVLGIRWFSPNHPALYLELPVNLKNFSITIHPSFPYRGLHVCAGNYHYEETVVRWMNRIKMNRKLTHHREVDIHAKQLSCFGLKPDTTTHSYSFWISDEKYFHFHPEWFAMIGGKRRRHAEGGQLCLSNKNMRLAFIRELLNYARKHPQISIIGFPPNDGYGWCECESCRRLDTENDRQKNQVNGRVADFVYDICLRIKKEHPELMLGHYSYSNFADFIDCRAFWPDNLIISTTISRCFRHTIDDPDCQANRQAWERLKKIREKIRHIYVYEYYMHRWQYLPAPIWKVVAKDIQAYHKLELDGFLSEVPGCQSPAYKSFHLPLYVAAACLYDIHTDWRKILDDYCHRRFGPAGPEMRKYLAELQSGLEKMEGCFLHRKDDLERLITPVVLEKASKILSAAEIKAENSPFIKEIKSEKNLFQRWTEIVRKRHSNLVEQPLKVNLPSPENTRKKKELILVDSISLIPPTKNRTLVYVSGNKNQGCLLIDCREEKMDQINYGKTNSPADIYRGENVEIFLSPSKDSKTVYHFLISPWGVHCASEATGSRWNWSWKGKYWVVLKRKKNGWTITFRFPLKTIAAKEGKWCFTVVRNRHIDGWEITGIPDGGAYFDPNNYFQVIPREIKKHKNV